KLLIEKSRSNLEQLVLMKECFQHNKVTTMYTADQKLRQKHLKSLLLSNADNYLKAGEDIPLFTCVRGRNLSLGHECNIYSNNGCINPIPIGHIKINVIGT